MLPTAAVRSPAARSIDSSIWVVVVLPLVPVMPSQGTGRLGRASRQASSGSLQMPIPAAAAAASSGWRGLQPVVTTRSMPSGRSALEPGPRRTSAPSVAQQLGLVGGAS